jgi:FkbH-like protein
LIAIGHELSLLPESFVFVDDNPAEREIVRRQIPGVPVPEVNKPEHYINIIDRCGYFETTNITRDDMNRGDMYKDNAERSKLQANFTDYGDYLRSLEMKAIIRAFGPPYMQRIAQLTNKSNQFNLTTKRYTQDEAESAASDGNHITLYGKLIDKFGDNGVVAITIGKVEGDICHIVLWLMSCRVLKRDMEFAMMDELVWQCKGCSVRVIKGYYYPTAKNGMVCDFYDKQGFSLESEDEHGNKTYIFQIPAAYELKNRHIEVNDR